MFYPKQPKSFNRVSWIMEQTGWKPKPWYWQPGTVMDFEDKGQGINRHCRDVSKTNVERIFKEVFGYSSFVDPSEAGKAVIKSEANGVHDGRIVERPYKLQENEICQRVINTGLTEYRPVIVERKVACVMMKKKKELFSSRGSTFSTHSPDILHPNEQQKIAAFCEKIGMDYGELDYLEDSKRYIVDANHCPGGVTDDFLNQSKQELDYLIECHRPLFKH